MVRYSPNYENDVVLLRWWQELLDSGDIASYPAELKVLSVFYDSLQEPTVLLVEADEQGIWFAFWYRRGSLPFAIVNLWIRQDCRHHPSALRAVHVALSHCFEQHGAIVAYCGEQKITQLYENFGLTKLEPGVQTETHPVTVLTMTREQYATAQKRSA